MSYSELSKFLGIDNYIAQLIGSAVYDISNANLRVGNSIT